MIKNSKKLNKILVNQFDYIFHPEWCMYSVLKCSEKCIKKYIKWLFVVIILHKLEFILICLIDGGKQNANFAPNILPPFWKKSQKFTFL